MSRFSFEQDIKSMPYCRMARFLTQFKRKYTVLNHIGFDSPHLKVVSVSPSCINTEASNASSSALLSSAIAAASAVMENAKSFGHIVSPPYSICGGLRLAHCLHGFKTTNKNTQKQRRKHNVLSALFLKMQQKRCQRKIVMRT